MAEEVIAESNVGKALMSDSSRVEQSIETEDKDIFDDVFGEDEEEKAAKKRMASKAEELKKQKLKAENKAAETGSEEENDSENDSEESQIVKENNTSKEKEAEDSDDDEDDEDEGGEEDDDEDSAEPMIFGEVIDKNEDEEESNKNSEKKRGAEKNEGGIAINNNGKNGKGYGGKLDLKVTHEEQEAKEEDDKAHPFERKIIKTVIKNKAILAAKDEVKVNKGVKIKDDSTPTKDDEHDEMAEELMRESGTREEGVSSGFGEDEPEEIPNTTSARMPKANVSQEEGDDDNDSGEGKVIKPELEFLMSKEKHAFIGRKKSVLGKYGEEGGLFVGKVYEKDKEGTEILLDGLNPHVVFVCGARGSGKSYVLGVVAEELAIKNKNVGIVVVDPIGVFWSMKHPNKEEKELEALAKWGLLPRGLDNISVFIPIGMKDSVPKSTYDAVFSIQPAMLTAEDWCLTFGIDRFSPTGLLMEKGISKVKGGYRTQDGKEIRGKQNTFSLEDLIRCFENDAELNDKERGYKADSIRALASRFDAAKHWGIFDDKGTSLGMLSRAGQMTILDTSFLEDNVSALVIGIISRRLLAARKLGTRREAAGQFESEDSTMEIAELNIPPTWLFIDEAHTLIPGGNQKTPASNALVEYVKQGRRPGCSLVFATQQPSAIDTKVLSQLDVIMAHKLVFDDDIKSIYKRTPAIVPGAYKKPSFIKTMPVGIALTGDRSETTSRAFIMSIRPRMSQHEGRDAETIEVKQELEKDKVELLAVNIVLRQLEKDPSIRVDSVKETLDTLNNTYKKNVSLDAILKALEKKGIESKEGYLYAKGVLEEIAADSEREKELEDAELAGKEGEAVAGYGASLLKGKKLPKGVEEFGEKLHEFEEKIELTALRHAVDETAARKRILSYADKKFGLFSDEMLDRISLKHAPIYKVKYKYFSHKDAFHVGEAYIDSITGEFLHDDNGRLRESKGLPVLLELNEAETTALKLVAEKRRKPKELAALMKMEEGNAKRILDHLAKRGLAVIIDDGKGSTVYSAGNKIEMELPPHPLHEMLPSVGKRPITEIDSASVIQAKFSEKEIPDLLKKLWGNVVVKEVTHLFLPVWEGTLKKRTGEERVIMIDGINGNKLNGI